jgi:capsular exopolysaccharide synthesis family protein
LEKDGITEVHLFHWLGLELSLQGYCTLSEQTYNAPGGQQEPQLPFSLSTLLIGLSRRWPILLGCIVLAVGLGVLAAYKLGTRTYTGKTVMIYKPIGGSAREVASALKTELQTVTIHDNLAEVRRQLELPMSTDQIKGACGVNVERGTTVITLTCQNEDSQLATKMANAVRAVFMENQKLTKRALLGAEVRELEDRLAGIRRKVEAADDALQDFKQKNNLIDVGVNIETQRFFDQMSVLEEQLARARIDKDAISLRSIDLERIEGEMLDGLSAEFGANIRIQMLVNAIQSDQENQQQLAELRSLERAVEMAEKMNKVGVLSRNDYEEAVAQYEKAKASTQETEGVQKLKQELIQAMNKRIRLIEKQKGQIQAQVDQLPLLQRSYGTLLRELNFWRNEQVLLEEGLAETRRSYDSNASEYNTISEATVPSSPSNSTRKLWAGGVMAIGGILGFVIILFLEVTDTRIKAGVEVPLKLSLPLIGVFPKLVGGENPLPSRTEPPLIDAARLMARNLRRIVPKKGARVLVVSAHHGEGNTQTVANLALLFGRYDERVLLIDAQVREQEHDFELRDLIDEETTAVKGLGEYLSFEVDEMDDVVWSTRLPGVECIPRVGEAVIPDLVGSNRMRDLLEEASERYSLILVDTPPSLPYVDAEVLAQWADAILFVVRSRTHRSGILNRAIDRVKVSGVPIVGVVLNQVESIYMEKEA